MMFSYFDILNRLGIDHECERQACKQMERLCDSKSHTSLHCMAKNAKSAMPIAQGFDSEVHCVCYLLTSFSVPVQVK